MSPILLAAFALLVLGVVGSTVSKFPGPPLSLAGVFVYWVGTGFSEPSILVLLAMVGVAVLAILGDIIGDTIADRVGEVSDGTAVIAGAVGSLLHYIFGPLGSLIGTALAVFLIEFLRQGDARAGFSALLAVFLRSVASRAIKILFTGAILVVMILVAFL